MLTKLITFACMWPYPSRPFLSMYLSKYLFNAIIVCTCHFLWQHSIGKVAPPIPFKVFLSHKLMSSSFRLPCLGEKTMTIQTMPRLGEDSRLTSFKDSNDICFLLCLISLCFLLCLRSLPNSLKSHHHLQLFNPLP